MDYPIEMWEELEPQNELLSPLEKAAWPKENFCRFLWPRKNRQGRTLVKIASYKIEFSDNKTHCTLTKGSCKNNRRFVVILVLMFIMNEWICCFLCYIIHYCRDMYGWVADSKTSPDYALVRLSDFKKTHDSTVVQTSKSSTTFRGSVKETWQYGRRKTLM
jgi:hypothetical protein